MASGSPRKISNGEKTQESGIKREAGPRAREKKTLSNIQAAPISPLDNTPLPLSPHPHIGLVALHDTSVNK